VQSTGWLDATLNAIRIIICGLLQLCKTCAAARRWVGSLLRWRFARATRK